MESLDKKFWTERYNKGETGWDIGYASPAIKDYIDSLNNKEIKILVPGAGNAYEVEYLWQQGFKNVYVLDISPNPLQNFKKRNPDFPDDQILLMDFFELKQSFDLVLEQTFFCALPPDMRLQYAQQMHKIIVPQGKLVGLMFGINFEKPGPPFGGNKQEYLTYFEPYFSIKKMDICLNSIPPRAGNELWVEMVRM